MTGRVEHLLRIIASDMNGLQVLYGTSPIPDFPVLIARCPSGLLSRGRAPSLAPSPLRTGLEGFPFIRLEHPKTPP
jgi:hypothetical protein